MISQAITWSTAGVELRLLDCVPYFLKADGINGVAQIVKDFGAKSNPRVLQNVSGACENSAGPLLASLGKPSWNPRRRW